MKMMSYSKLIKAALEGQGLTSLLREVLTEQEEDRLLRSLRNQS